MLLFWEGSSLKRRYQFYVCLCLRVFTLADFPATLWPCVSVYRSSCTLQEISHDMWPIMMSLFKNVWDLNVLRQSWKHIQRGGLSIWINRRSLTRQSQSRIRSSILLLPSVSVCEGIPHHHTYLHFTVLNIFDVKFVAAYWKSHFIVICLVVFLLVACNCTPTPCFTNTTV